MKSNALPIRVKRLAGLILLALGLFGLLAVREANRVISTRVTSWSQDPTADCAVVLTGGAGRVREGIALLEQGLVKTLIISGVNPQTELQDLLSPVDLAMGIKREQVILERRSQTTYGNAHQSAPILEALRCRDLALVTSRLHMYRARKSFEAALPSGVKIISVAVPSPKVEEEIWGLTTEVLKSMFYSLWAYP